MVKKYKMILGVVLTIFAIGAFIYIMRSQRTFTVTFDTKGGTIYQAAEVRVNEKVTKPADPLMAGYIFKGWYLNDTDDVYDFNTPVTKNITITAKWEEIS